VPGIEISLAAFAVGAVVGMTGVGGGALMMPILVLLFGVAPGVAVGTDLLFAAITKTAGAAIHGWRGTIDWQVCRRLALGSLPAAALTGWFIHHLQAGAYQVDRLILHALGVMLLVTAAGLLAKGRLHQLGRRLRLADATRFRRLQPLLTVLAGIVLGVVVTLTSVGAGALGAVALLYLYPLRLTPARLVGTDLAHAIPLAAVAGASHWLLGNVDRALLGWMLLGSVPGVLLGAHWATRAPDGAACVRSARGCWSSRARRCSRPDGLSREHEAAARAASLGAPTETGPRGPVPGYCVRRAITPASTCDGWRSRCRRGRRRGARSCPARGRATGCWT